MIKENSSRENGKFCLDGRALLQLEARELDFNDHNGKLHVTYTNASFPLYLGSCSCNFTSNLPRRFEQYG